MIHCLSLTQHIGSRCLNWKRLYQDSSNIFIFVNRAQHSEFHFSEILQVSWERDNENNFDKLYFAPLPLYDINIVYEQSVID